MNTTKSSTKTGRTTKTTTTAAAKPLVYNDRFSIVSVGGLYGPLTYAIFDNVALMYLVDRKGFRRNFNSRGAARKRVSREVRNLAGVVGALHN